MNKTQIRIVEKEEEKKMKKFQETNNVCILFPNLVVQTKYNPNSFIRRELLNGLHKSLKIILKSNK